jgi:DNA-binding response OmpR family regulator
MRSTAAFGRLEHFHFEPELDVGRAVQRPDTGQATLQETNRTSQRNANRSFVRTVSPGSNAVSFCWKATSPPLGSRSLEILIALLERHRELVSNQNLMARVWAQCFR